MRVHAFVLWSCLLAPACNESDRSVSDVDCAAIRDRAIDLSLATSDVPDDVRAAHRAQLRDALGREYLALCDQMTVAERDCRLAAASPDDLRTCSTGGSR